MSERGAPGYWNSPWPGEDGGPWRSQAPAGIVGIAARPDRAPIVTYRDAFGATMLVLRERGELFALRHTMPVRPSDSCTAWVERLDPETLATAARSPDLEAGPFWPGGMACHANGSLYVVFGRHGHRLGSDLAPICCHALPRPRPCNSFVLLFRRRAGRTISTTARSRRLRASRSDRARSSVGTTSRSRSSRRLP